MIGLQRFAEQSETPIVARIAKPGKTNPARDYGYTDTLLEHPGIVPVYGLGSYADGRPFYAMRFIKGDSLKDAIDRFHRDGSLTADPGRRSLELRKLLRRLPTSATRSTTRTAAGCCTATSSPA